MIARQCMLPLSGYDRVAFYDLSRGRKTPLATQHFAGKHGLPIVSDPMALDGLATVFFTLHSWRDFFELAKLHKRKGSAEWIAGGNATATPLSVAWALDYLYVGDAWADFEAILAGDRDLPGMLNCRNPGQVVYQEREPMPEPFMPGKVVLATGCKHRCVFCVTGWRRGYAEADQDRIEEHIRRAAGSGRKGVMLLSNSTADVSYCDELQEMLERYGVSNTRGSNALAAVTPELVEKQKTSFLFGIEGMHEDVRRAVGKPISRERLHSVLDLVLSAQRRLRTVYQFGLPGELSSDFDGFADDVRAIRARHSAGGWSIPFIPNQVSAHTPLQWDAPHYDLEMHARLDGFSKELRATRDDFGALVFMPNILQTRGWMTQTLAEWVEVTPELDRALRKLPANAPLPEQLERLGAAGHDVAYVFEPKPRDYEFPWDIVETPSHSREQRERMRITYEKRLRRSDRETASETRPPWV